MQIIHKIDDFLYTIFPELIKNDETSIINILEVYYSYGPFKPKISISNGWVKIDIDVNTIITQESDYKKTIDLCERGNFSEAKTILEKLIENNPTNSEYYRIMGQILSEQGNQDEAINFLIDALRWDSKNGYALLMMGNIFAKFKDDVSTAMKYYDQALIVNPKDNITINNIGAYLMQQGKLEEATKYFNKALKIDSQYPNTHYALGMISEIENDFQSAFNNTIKAIKFNKNKDALYNNCVKQAFVLANKISVTAIGEKTYTEYLHKLEFDCEREIEIIQDEKIPTAAKFEFAENYDRQKHIIRYKPGYPAVEHLIMHELVHLDFVIEARKAEINQLFIATQNHKSEFIKDLDSTIKKLKKIGVSEKGISDFCTNLFNGLNSQVFNTPIDLFIENFLYNKYPELRPYQFLSLSNMIQEGLNAVTDKKVIEISPSHIISKSKIYNLVNAIQFKSLFGIDLIKDFKASKSELTLANDFYEEYLEYKDDKEPAEEYELILHWAEDLKLDNNFELVGESQYRKRSNVDDFIDALEKDPFGVNEKDPSKEREMKKFQQTQAEIGLNMAVVMFMVDALNFFEKMPLEETKKIAYEIAMQGTQGYNPDKKDYRISAVKGKLFSGYNILAYYYVSWSLAIPEMISQLGLPFEKEYQLALTMHKPKS